IQALAEHFQVFVQNDRGPGRDHAGILPGPSGVEAGFGVTYCLITNSDVVDLEGFLTLVLHQDIHNEIDWTGTIDVPAYRDGRDRRLSERLVWVASKGHRRVGVHRGKSEERRVGRE